MSFIIDEVEKTVATDRPAYRPSKLLPPVVWLGNAFTIVDGVVGIKGGVQHVIVAIAVHRIRAALRHCVHQAPACLAELGFKSRARDLKLANHIFAELVWNAGSPNLLLEKCIVIIGAVHRVVIEVARNSIEADHAEIAVGRCSRR